MGILDNKLVALSLRIIQAVLAIIILGLAAYVAHWWSDYWHTSSPSEFRFLIFCSVWSFLALIYLIVVPWRFSETKLHHAFVILGVEMVTMIFWFAGFIAVAVFIHDRGCFGTVCSAAKAAAVFGAFEWVAFALTTALSVLHVRSVNRVGKNTKADPNLNVQGQV